MLRRFTAATLAGLLAAAGAAAAPVPQHPLDAAFAKADGNKDGFLDPAELARAFRGKNAKPVEHKETGKAHVETKHPDHALLEAYDANDDERLSKAEFERYEQRLVAQAKAASARAKKYSRTHRGGYRAKLSHRRGPARRR